MLTARERVLKALNHEETDRVPIDFAGTLVTGITKGAYENLLKNLGYSLPSESIDIIQGLVRPDESISKLFGNDCYVVIPDTSNDWSLEIRSDNEAHYFIDEWGIEYKQPRGGLYFDVHKSPLEKSTIKDIKNYPWPEGGCSGRVKTLKKRAEEMFNNTEYCLTVNDGHWGIMCHAAFLIGFERFYTSFVDDTDFVESVMDRTLQYEIDYWDSILQQVDDYIQVVQIGDDLGNQLGPNINPDMYRKYVKPRHRELIEFIKKNTNSKIFFHSCGAVYKFIPEFIDIGVDILNPVQVSAAGMDSQKLKSEFGKDLSFWGGGCDTQNVLPKGTVEDVRQEVRKRIQDLGKGGGFIFCPVHNIQADVPPENLKAMFETAIKFKR